jgi:N-acetylneuraminic acid mutarotase
MGSGSLGDLWRFNTLTSAWSPVTSASGEPPQPRSYHTMAASGGRLYVFGGCGAGGRLNDLHAYDTEAGAWAQLPTSEAVAPRGGSSLTAAPNGTKLYVVAGGPPGAAQGLCCGPSTARAAATGAIWRAGRAA